MSLLAGLFVCLRLCVLAGDIKISASVHSQLDGAAPAWSSARVGPALREHRLTLTHST